jgi:hypothetical protein
VLQIGKETKPLPVPSMAQHQTAEVLDVIAQRGLMLSTRALSLPLPSDDIAQVIDHVNIIARTTDEGVSCQHVRRASRCHLAPAKSLPAVLRSVLPTVPINAPFLPTLPFEFQNELAYAATRTILALIV